MLFTLRVKPRVMSMELESHLFVDENDNGFPVA